jgi:hypothetical protein
VAGTLDAPVLRPRVPYSDRNWASNLQDVCVVISPCGHPLPAHICLSIQSRQRLRRVPELQFRATARPVGGQLSAGRTNSNP